ncbi:hypothetical protein [Oceanirhabdus seepicola]|uniref:Uncharacterized protein n=1 Tax=Oceanirhabdus seepicola TaxID=2828781 RepID=A0A9J6NYY1_9CLOT|nr:hypothetical protein [Oceanirhabdus seepicola]MCM1989260.1 hypothetical protein [Oceanirhabdus seepicola]
MAIGISVKKIAGQIVTLEVLDGGVGVDITGYTVDLADGLVKTGLAVSVVADSENKLWTFDADGDIPRDTNVDVSLKDDVGTPVAGATTSFTDTKTRINVNKIETRQLTLEVYDESTNLGVDIAGYKVQFSGGLEITTGITVALVAGSANRKWTVSTAVDIPEGVSISVQLYENDDTTTVTGATDTFNYESLTNGYVSRDDKALGDTTGSYKVQIVVTNPDGTDYTINSEAFTISSPPADAQSFITILKPYLVQFKGENTDIRASLIDSSGAPVSDGNYELTVSIVSA